jgi:hypothetical protein
VGFAEITAADLAGIAGAERAFRNVNAPGDLRPE